jgi:hypothetical protein
MHGMMDAMEQAQQQRNALMSIRKVGELEGALLDAAVAKAEGFRFRIVGDTCWLDEPLRPSTHYPESSAFDPSMHWGDGGPIIERERIGLASPGSNRHPGKWAAWTCADVHEFYGANPLIAAMRAYVASKFGDEIELP